VLSLALAVLFVESPSDRHDLGVAAVLHDVGKFGLPQEVIDQDLALSGLEWELNYDHPRIGLERLLTIPRAPQVAQIVAFDHHLTQRGGYPTLPEPRPPHPAAALVAVAEVVDIMATVRLPREQIGPGEIASTLREGAGGAFEPTFATAMAALWDVVQ
jgi:HD-GYP domain-containing protein (c-di-GMP phosphodiesterase class II)